jgi:predicted aconitase with swiveling domain/8-oxo-dGTP pyrophosphatase MutT (NUDIX family)
VLMNGRRIRGGRARGKALSCDSPLSFLGGVDTSDGKVLDRECCLHGTSVAGKILCFPHGRGSTVGSYALYQLKLKGVAPTAIVNRSAEAIVATGAIMSEIPMVDGIDVSVIANDDTVRIDADRGTVELPDVSERHVVTCILRNRGEILILRRSDKVGSYRGRWAGVSGFIEEGESDEEAAWREMGEELGLRKAKLSARAPARSFRHDEVVWTVHPFLLDVRSRELTTDWEHDSYAWIRPRELGRYATVPGLDVVLRSLIGDPSP